MSKIAGRSQFNLFQFSLEELVDAAPTARCQYIFVFYFSEIENMLKVAADGGHEEAKRALREMYPESY